MKLEDCVSMLTEHGIKPTSNRIVVLKELAASPHPVTLNELEMHILSIDKSGIFRALTLFRENHLAHVIDDGSGAVRYELCHSRAADTDDDLHVHFLCEECRQVYCLDGVPVPQVDMPPGFSAVTASHIVTGVCPKCSDKNHR